MDRGEGRCGEVASAVGQTVELHWADRSIESKVTLDYLQALLRKYIHSRIQDEASGSFSLWVWPRRGEADGI